ncbi:hypothetical protein D3C78_09290 [compost metagenome]
MWLTDLLRKLTKGPNVGETFRDYIGCYLFGTEVAGAPKPEYIGAPATLEQLEVEVRRYLQDFISTQKGTVTPEVQTVQDLLTDLPQRLFTHVHGDMSQPFISFPSIDMFIRKGVRQRRKENGKFVE